MSKNFIDRFYEEDTKDEFWSLNKKIGIGFVVLFLAVVMINTTGCTQNQEDLTNIPNDTINNPADVNQLPQDTVTVGNDGVKAAIAPDGSEDISIVSNSNGTNKMVAMSVEDTGRNDPFLPESENIANKPKPKLPYDLIVPPETITSDSEAVEVISTKVSGIMYDAYNPSAILNIDGSDHLVRSGDVINNYKILSIGKSTVTVQLGANVYKAGVGQLFTTDGINYNTISNLERKFGGNKNIVNYKK